MTVTAPGRAWPAAPLDHLMDLAEWDALPEDNSARSDYALVAVHAAVAPLVLGGTQRGGADAPEAGHRVTLSL